MKVRQIFFKTFCQRCTKPKKKKKKNESDDWEGIIFQIPGRAWGGNT